MSNAINLRVRQSDVSAVIPIYSGHQSLDPDGPPSFGILYQKIEHIQFGGKPCQQLRREFTKLTYDRHRDELIT